MLKIALIVLYNTLSISTKAHLESQNEIVLNDVKFNQEDNQQKVRKSISIKTHINESKINSKTHVKQQTLFDFDYDK